MQASLTGVGVGVFLLLAFALFGGPMHLVDWLRRRRQTAMERQVALTDALDGRLGALVAPVVRKPLFGPWEIRIAVPLHRSATVARILTGVAEVLQDIEGAGSRSYRILLSAKPDSLQGISAPRAHRSVERWAGGRAAA